MGLNNTSFLDSNDTIIALMLDDEEKREIGYSIIDYLENNRTILPNDLKIVLNYLKDIPQQGEKILELIYKIGGYKTAQLLDSLSTQMMLTLIIHIDINNFSKVINQYNMYEIIHTINEFNHYNISREGEKHVLIKSINSGQLPGIIDEIINIYRRIKRTVDNLLK